VEYKVNKIDTERRKQINDASKEGIIHGYDTISIYKNKEENQDKNKEAEVKDNNSQHKKIVIEATKAEEIQIETYKEELTLDIIDKGTFLDKRG
jgi:hypothetical protein